MDRETLEFLNESQLNQLVRYYEGEIRHQRDRLEKEVLAGEFPSGQKVVGAIEQLRHLVADAERHIREIQKGQA